MSDDGGFVVAWSARWGQGFAQIYSPEGSPVGDAFQVHDQSGQFSAAAIADDGSIVLVWQLHSGDGRNTPGEVLVRRYSAAGTPLSDAIRVVAAIASPF